MPGVCVDLSVDLSGTTGDRCAPSPAPHPLFSAQDSVYVVSSPICYIRGNTCLTQNIT